MAESASEVMQRCTSLANDWSRRNAKIKEWYKLIQMVDQLEQKNMESFVGNDPRATYNLMLHLLDCKIPHKIPIESLTLELMDAASAVEDLYNTAWEDVFLDHRAKGGQSWLRDLIGFTLISGWYAVFATISLDGRKCIAEVWNPATVYPLWDNKLVECAHITTLNPTAAIRMADRNDWKLLRKPTGNATLYDYWKEDTAGRVYDTVVLDNTLVKEQTHEIRFNRIPIFTAPVGGLPDTGVMSSDSTVWREEIGQSIIATNENIYKYVNKWLTFAMQLLRDTAQSRWFEQSASGKPIIKPEDVFKRGAVFRGGPQDKIAPLGVPPIPVELRAMLLDLEAMLQRGGPSWAMFGNIQQQLTAYVMSQIAASANQIAKPYHQAVIGAVSDIDNFWLDLMRTYDYKPYGKSLPKELPNNIRLSAEYEIRIPGDLVQRATTARILDPNFELSPTRIMEELFPEIKNPLEEMAKIRAAKAERHPVRAIIAMVESFRKEAKILSDAGDKAGARLYEKAADKAEAMLNVEEAETPTRTSPGVRPEVVPPESPSPGPVV